MVTINDVAKAAGVAKGTVSHVLNQTAPVAEQTKKRVLQAVEDLKYTPSFTARNLAKGNTNIIGLVVPMSPYIAIGAPWHGIINGIHSAIVKYDYSILLIIADESQNYMKFYERRAVDGLLVTTLKVSEEKQVYELSKSGFPIVLMSRAIDEQNISSVDIDNELGAFKAVKYLLSLGRERIAFLGPSSPELLVSIDRLSGYKKAVDQAVAYDEGLVIYAEHNKDAYERTKELLDKYKDLSGFFVADDVLVEGVYKAIFEANFRIPDDIAVVGFNDLPIASLIKPSLTTVKIPFYDIGYKSGEMLLRIINGSSKRAEKITLESELIIRESTV